MSGVLLGVVSMRVPSRPHEGWRPNGYLCISAGARLILRYRAVMRKRKRFCRANSSTELAWRRPAQGGLQVARAEVILFPAPCAGFNVACAGGILELEAVHPHSEQSEFWSGPA